MSDKMAGFSQDLNVSMTEVRRLLEHWGLGEWQEYLVVRRPGQPESFIVLAHPSDKSDFAEQLIALHKGDAISHLQYMSEVVRIIEGATRGDSAKVKAYAELLAEKLEADGEVPTANNVRKIASGNAGARIVLHSTAGADSRSLNENFIEVQMADCRPFIALGARVKSGGREFTVTEVDDEARHFFADSDTGNETRGFCWGEKARGTIGVESHRVVRPG